MKKLLLLLAMMLLWLFPAGAWAHCDTLDGPVVTAARAALAAGEATPVLRWVRAADEAEITAVFTHTLAVRKLGPEAQELADRFFFETLVRVHRAGEGAPYTGLKPAGTTLPIIAEADAALAGGSAGALITRMQDHLRRGISERFARALQARDHAEHSVTAGRDYVAAYIAYVHYVEGVRNAIMGEAGEAETATPAHVPATGHAH
ncbi:MAG TPA: DUF6448 family protein [bacterium]|nr:DUF6448 family protein [bacterium]